MYLARLNRLRTALARANLECAAAIAGPNLYYLTGLSFHLSERPTVAFFPLDGDPVLIAGNLEATKVASGAPYPVRTSYYTDADGPSAAFDQAARTLLPQMTASETGAPTRPRWRLGVEMQRMRIMELRLLEASFPRIEVGPADACFARLRMTKDESEISLMRRAAAIAERALAAALPNIRAGMTEHEVAAELVVQTLRAGSDAELPFSPIVASGPNSALPHATVTDRALQPGDLLTLDWGAAASGYFSDLTRTFAIGPIHADFTGIYELVRRANAAGKAAARPGVTCASVDAAARKVIADGGYGQFFVHRLGHGLGLEGHEEPSMHGNNDLRLEAGMTFTVEPGIYLPGKGGVRIEDDVVVTADGCESLSTYPRELQVIGG